MQEPRWSPECHPRAATVIVLITFLASLSQLLEYHDGHGYMFSKENERTSEIFSHPASHRAWTTVSRLDVVLRDHLGEEEVQSIPLSPFQTHKDILVFPYPKLVRTNENRHKVRDQVLSLLSIDNTMGLHVEAWVGGGGGSAHTVKAAERMFRKLRRRKRKEGDGDESFHIAYVGALQVNITGEPPHPTLPYHPVSWRSSEDYVLSLTPGGKSAGPETRTEALLHAPTYRGAIAGLTSLTQLLSSNASVELPLYIADFPEHPWRGLLLDVARHFIPLHDIHSMVDAMEMAKLNVLHLHLTDSQSFPVLLKDIDGLPLSQLATLGSTRGPGNESRVYSLDDLSGLVRYAWERGIEIVPELDVPAHSSSWGKAFPDLIVRCPKYIQKLLSQKGGSSSAQIFRAEDIYSLNATNPTLLKVIDGILQQLVGVFPSDYLHVGGDEVDLNCWKEEDNEALEGIRHVDRNKAFGNFEKDLFAMVRALKKIPMSWQGVMDMHGMPTEDRTPKGEESVVQPWKCWGGLAVRASRAALDGVDVSRVSSLHRPVQVPLGQYAPGRSRPFHHTNSSAHNWSRSNTNANQSSLIPYLRGSRVSSGTSDGRQRRLLSSYSTPGNSRLSGVSSNTTRSGVIHPIVQSACWYLDFDWDIDRYFASDELKAVLNVSAAYTSEPYTLGEFWSDKENEFGERNKRGRYRGKIFGGEASMWTERVDYTNLACRVWPRAGVIAASLWGSEWSTPLQDGAEQKSVFSEDMSNIQEAIAQKIGMYALYGSFRDFLANSMGIPMAPLVLHKVTEHPGPLASTRYNPRYKDLEFAPATFYSTADLIHTLASYLEYTDDMPQSLTSFLSTSDTLSSRSFNGTQLQTASSNITEAAMRSRIKRFRLAAQLSCSCAAYSAQIERPLASEVTAVDGSDQVYDIDVEEEQFVSIAQLNVADGATGPRREMLGDWLRGLARSGANIVTFCEANTWEVLESETGIEKNRPVIEKVAADGGFRYSHVETFSKAFIPPDLSPFLLEMDPRGGEMTCSDCVPHPYNIGIMSALPFVIVGSYGPPIFQRGLVHIYFESLDTHVFVAHLHAHSAQRREQEAELIVRLLGPYLSAGKRVILTGDFNSLSPLDSSRYEEMGLPTFYDRRDDPVFDRLRKKFCQQSSIQTHRRLLISVEEAVEWATAAGNASVHTISPSPPSSQSQITPTSTEPTQRSSSPKLNYDPIELLLKAGLYDACVSSCRGSEDCKGVRCAATEPTAIDTEWPHLRDGAKRMDVRLDYILISEAVLDEAGASLRSIVQRGPSTDMLSDHYPVLASWKWKMKKS